MTPNAWLVRSDLTTLEFYASRVEGVASYLWRRSIKRAVDSDVWTIIGSGKREATRTKIMVTLEAETVSSLSALVEELIEAARNAIGLGLMLETGANVLYRGLGGLVSYSTPTYQGKTAWISLELVNLPVLSGLGVLITEDGQAAITAEDGTRINYEEGF